MVLKAYLAGGRGNERMVQVRTTKINKYGEATAQRLD